GSSSVLWPVSLHEDLPIAGVTVEAVDDVQNRRFQASADDKGIFSLIGLTAGKSYDVAFNRLGYERYVERGSLVRAGDNNSLLVRDRKSTRLNSIHVKTSYA